MKIKLFILDSLLFDLFILLSNQLIITIINSN